VINRVPETLDVFVDADLIGLALRQLVDNAIKYSPSSSTIQIDAAVEAALTISVRNSGSFVPAAELDRLFERFYRGSTARHVPGTGIGLSIVQEIARAHGGSLTVTSQPDRGTTFVVSIPGGATR
jgi:signal transduction histidine kinase